MGLEHGSSTLGHSDPDKPGADQMAAALDRLEARVATLEAAIERHCQATRRREAAGAPIHRGTLAQAPNETLWGCLDD